jgi:hypothetical protein
MAQRYAPGEYPDEYPLSVLSKEDQAHPDVIRLTGAMSALTEARAVLRGAASAAPAGPDPAVLLPLLARAARLDSSAASCFSGGETAAILAALFQTLPAARALFGGTLDTLPKAYEVLQLEESPEPSALTVDAYCVLCLQLLLMSRNGAYPVEPLVKQLLEATAIGNAIFSPPVRVYLLEKLAVTVPLWTKPITVAGLVLGANKLGLQSDALQRAAALEPDGARRGDILWRIGASYHMQLTEQGLAMPEGAIEKARAALLGAARLLPLGSLALRNLYLRLACLVVEAAGGEPTTPTPGGFNCAISGPEMGLFTHWVDKARGARAGVLAAHAARWPSGDRAENDALYARLRAHDRAFASSRVCACSLCHKRCASRRCAVCFTVYCGSECQHKDWAVHKGPCRLLARAAVQLREQGEFGGREALDADVQQLLGPSGRLRLEPRAPVREVD